MSKSNADSDTKLKVNTSVINSSCSSFKAAVSDAGLSSINISSTFSALIDCGVGSSFFSSLETSLGNLEKLTSNISSLINIAAEEQEETDNLGVKEATNNNYGGASYNRDKGSSDNAVTAVSNASTGYYDVDNKENNTSINSDNVTDNIKLDDSEQEEVTISLQSISSDDIPKTLDNDEAVSSIKKVILEQPNISDDLKEKLLDMDENEIRVELKNILSSGEVISDFSKAVITIFDNDLKNNYKHATIYDSSDNIAKVYNYLAKDHNCQSNLKDIYMGISNMDNVDKKVVEFTRSFVDLMATSNNVSYEDILNDSKYQADLIEGIEDIGKSFTMLYTAKNSGITSELYSNIIVGG